MKKFCIIIPIYKEELDLIDKLSLERLHKVVKNKYDICLVKPESLNSNNYYKILKKKNVKEILFADRYFENTSSYSQLCLQYDFYDKFSDYEYMYIYQTDCYLIEDKLEEWCNKGYDYIGAPIFVPTSGWPCYTSNSWEPQVGNGGFSLRKIELFKEITDPNGELRQTYKLTDEILSKVIYEDKYFCTDLYKYYDIKKPSWKEAMLFALDMNPEITNNIIEESCNNMNNMGIHAWAKNIRYWKDKLEELKDNKEVIDYCENKYKDFFELYYHKN